MILRCKLYPDFDAGEKLPTHDQTTAALPLRHLIILRTHLSGPKSNVFFSARQVSVDFGSLAPFSHNKICALSRTRITTALYGSGKSVVDHAAGFLVARDADVGARGRVP